MADESKPIRLEDRTTILGSGARVIGREFPYKLYFRFSDTEFTDLMKALKPFGPARHPLIRFGIEIYAGDYISAFKFRQQEPGLKELREELADLRAAISGTAALSSRLRNLSRRAKHLLKQAGLTGDETDILDVLVEAEGQMENLKVATSTALKNATSRGPHMPEPSIERDLVSGLAWAYQQHMGIEPTETLSSKPTAFNNFVSSAFDAIRAHMGLAHVDGGVGQSPLREGIKAYRAWRDKPRRQTPCP